MSKFKKIDKEFLHTDSSLNVYSFRLLTSGYLLDEYKRNPIGYRMHDRNDGVIVRWEDFRVDGDKVYAKPVINLSHPKGQQTVDEVENGFLNGASVGHYVIIEVSDDPALKLPDQIGPTVTKWYNRECSLVDIPGNTNSLSLFDVNDNPIKLENLADFSSKNLNMIKHSLTPEQITKILNLKADADATAVNDALENLSAQAALVPDLQAKLVDAEKQRQKALQDLADLKKTTSEKEIADLVAGAVTATKITKEVGEKLAKQFEGKPTELKELLDAMPVYKSITKELKDEEKKGGEELKNMTWAQLDKANKLEDLKAKDIEAFKTKYKEEFGVDYKG